MAAVEDEALVELALRMAVARRHPEAGLLHHSDRGTEFTSDRYQAALHELGIEVSRSRTANCWDHGAMESFFATLTRVVYRSHTLPEPTASPISHFRVPGVLL